MSLVFTIATFSKRFPTDDVCLEAIRRLRYPKGITCNSCRKITRHYKIKNRTAYTCKICRTQVHPLKGTIFEKTTTPLRLWFYALFLVSQTKGIISARQLQHELGVTYKTAWRMKHLLINTIEDAVTPNEQEKVHKWLFFNKIEFKVAERKQVES